MQAAHLAFISPKSEATISAYLPLSPKEFSPSCTPKKTLLHSYTLLNSSKITISSIPLNKKSEEPDQSDSSLYYVRVIRVKKMSPEWLTRHS
jgi:hypothetical protein